MSQFPSGDESFIHENDIFWVVHVRRVCVSSTGMIDGR